MKSPYGVGRYCDMAVSPTRSHLLWKGRKDNSTIATISVTIKYTKGLFIYYVSTSDEPELEFSNSSGAEPSQAELGHFNFQAETELKFFMHY